MGHCLAYLNSATNPIMSIKILSIDNQKKYISKCSMQGINMTITLLISYQYLLCLYRSNQLIVFARLSIISNKQLLSTSNICAKF